MLDGPCQQLAEFAAKQQPGQLQQLLPAGGCLGAVLSARLVEQQLCRYSRQQQLGRDGRPARAQLLTSCCDNWLCSSSWPWWPCLAVPEAAASSQSAAAQPVRPELLLKAAAADISKHCWGPWSAGWLSAPAGIWELGCSSWSHSLTKPRHQWQSCRSASCCTGWSIRAAAAQQQSTSCGWPAAADAGSVCRVWPRAAQQSQQLYQLLQRLQQQPLWQEQGLTGLSLPGCDALVQLQREPAWCRSGRHCSKLLLQAE